jgi:hypothetical protein
MTTLAAKLLVSLLFLAPIGLPYLLFRERVFDNMVAYAVAGSGSYIVVGASTVLCRHRPRLYDRLIVVLAMMLLANSAGCLMAIPTPSFQP